MTALLEVLLKALLQALQERQSTAAAIATIPQGQLDILAAIKSLEQQVSKMSQTLDTDLTQLQQDVSSNGDVVQSAIAAFTGLAGKLATIQQQLAAAGVQPAQLQALTTLHTSLAAQSAQLAAAVAANTPADPSNANTTDANPPAPVTGTGTSTSTEGTAQADTTT